MLKILNLFAIIFILSTGNAFAQSCNPPGQSGCGTIPVGSNQLDQSQDQYQINYGSNGSGTSEIPRSFAIPMPTPQPPNHAGYWGVITPDWTHQKVQSIVAFKGKWYPTDIERLCQDPERPNGKYEGKVLIQAKVFENLGQSDGVTVVTHEAPANSEEMKRFRRNFRQIGSIFAKGLETADSERVMGEAMKRAIAVGAVLMIPTNEGAQLVLMSKSKFYGIGISPSIVGGGSNSAPAGSFVLGYGSGKATAQYDANPWQQWKLFAPGVEETSDIAKLWKLPGKPAAAAPKQGMNRVRGVEGVEKNSQYGAETADQPLTPPVVNQQH